MNALQLALQEWTFTAEQATSIDQPVLYVLGADSLAIFHEGLGLARSWVPQAETALTPPTSHLLQMESPEPVGQALVEFFPVHAMQ